jgi:hypothetical protein
MVEFLAIQDKVCSDTILRMVRAKKQNDEEAFNQEMVKLCHVLEILKTSAPSAYVTYSKYLETKFKDTN